MSDKKNVPNPNGRKGCEEHQNLIQKIFNSIIKKGLIAIFEYFIEVENGEKKSRFIDVAAIDTETD